MNNTIRNSMINVSFEEHQASNNALEVKFLLFHLKNCKDLIKKAQKRDTSLLSESELYHHNKLLELQLKKRNVLLAKLSKLGYDADRRGRPKKKDSEKYKSTHVRMTCYFTPMNITKLKALKEDGSINNISSFLDDIIGSYFALSNDDVNDEKES